MFQNIVNATEPMTDEKESIAFVSNNPIRKEIVMYVSRRCLFEMAPRVFVVHRPQGLRRIGNSFFLSRAPALSLSL